MPAAFVLAGGYTWGITMAELVDLHLHTVRAFAGRHSRAAPEPSVSGDLSSVTRQPTHTTKHNCLDGAGTLLSGLNRRLFLTRWHESQGVWSAVGPTATVGGRP